MARHSAAEHPAPSSWRRAEPAARGAAPRTPTPRPRTGPLPGTGPETGPTQGIGPARETAPIRETRPAPGAGPSRENRPARETRGGWENRDGWEKRGRDGGAVRPSPPPRPSPWRGVARRLGSVLLLVVVAVAVAVTVVPVVVGGTGLTVLSPSMTPTYPVGSLVVIRPRPVEDIRIGDVVSFTSRDPATGATRTVTHRVVGVDPGPSFRTKGDANADPDPAPVAATEVRGVVWYSLPEVGAWGSALRTGPGLLIAGGAVLLLVALLFLVPRRRPAG